MVIFIYIYLLDMIELHYYIMDYLIRIFFFNDNLKQPKLIFA